MDVLPIAVAVLIVALSVWFWRRRPAPAQVAVDERIEGTMQLAGLEHIFSKMVTTIALSVQLRASSAAAVQRMCDQSPRAWSQVVARHPLMRSFLVQTEQGTCARVHKRLDDDVLARMVSIEVAASEPEWKQRVHEATHTRIDYSSTPPYSLLILRPAPHMDQCTVRVITFSPHHAGDGFSHFRVLYDFLTALTKGSVDAPLPIQLPLLHRWFGLNSEPALSPMLSPELTSWSRGWWSALRTMLQCCFQRFVIAELRSYKPILPVLPSVQGELKYPYRNIVTCRALYQSGQPANLPAAREACRSNQVTVHGALLAAITVAFAQQKMHQALLASQQARNDAERSVAVALDVDYNRRKARFAGRLPVPLGDDHVGLNISLGTLEPFKAGIELKRPFWQLAREAKRWTDGAMNSLSTKLTVVAQEAIVGQDHFWRRIGEELRDGLTTDINVSNLGSYPFPVEHEFAGSHDSLSISTLHVFNSSHPLTAIFIFYLNSVDQFNYSLSYRTSTPIASRWFANVVSIMENLHTIKGDETLEQVNLRLCS